MDQFFSQSPVKSDGSIKTLNAIFKLIGAEKLRELYEAGKNAAEQYWIAGA